MELCVQMITFVCEMYPEKLCHQPGDLLTSILMTVEMGLVSLGQEVNNMCCDIIQSLGTYVHRHGVHGGKDDPAHQTLRPFLKVHGLLCTIVIKHLFNGLFNFRINMFKTL